MGVYQTQQIGHKCVKGCFQVQQWKFASVCNPRCTQAPYAFVQWSLLDFQPFSCIVVWIARACMGDSFVGPAYCGELLVSLAPFGRFWNLTTCSCSSTKLLFYILMKQSEESANELRTVTGQRNGHRCEHHWQTIKKQDPQLYIP